MSDVIGPTQEEGSGVQGSEHALDPAVEELGPVLAYGELRSEGARSNGSVGKHTLDPAVEEPGLVHPHGELKSAGARSNGSVKKHDDDAKKLVGEPSGFTAQHDVDFASMADRGSNDSEEPPFSRDISLSPSRANSQRHSPVPPDDSQRHSSLPPADSQRHSSVPPADSQRHSSLPPADSQRHSSLPPADSQRYSSLPPADSQRQSSLPPADSPRHSSLLPADSQRHSPVPPADSQRHSPLNPSTERPAVPAPYPYRLDPVTIINPTITVPEEYPLQTWRRGTPEPPGPRTQPSTQTLSTGPWNARAAEAIAVNQTAPLWEGITEPPGPHTQPSKQALSTSPWNAGAAEAMAVNQTVPLREGITEQPRPRTQPSQQTMSTSPLNTGAALVIAADPTPPQPVNQGDARAVTPHPAPPASPLVLPGQGGFNSGSAPWNSPTSANRSWNDLDFPEKIISSLAILLFLSTIIAMISVFRSAGKHHAAISRRILLCGILIIVASSAMAMFAIRRNVGDVLHTMTMLLVLGIFLSLFQDVIYDS